MSEVEIHCSKEKELACLQTEMHDVVKILKGNGQKGMQAQVIILNDAVPRLTDAVDELTDKVQRLLDNKVVYDTERNLKLSARQKLTAIISGIIGGGTVIVMIVDMILKSS